MKVLVAYASKHESTHGLAEAIGRELRAQGVDADVRDAHTLPSVDAYEAVVLGSAVYMGNWLEDAKKFAYQHHEALVMRPLWLFSSGPIGAVPKPEGDPQGVPPIIELLQPREHVIFSGKLDKAHLNLGERIAVRFVGSEDGDYRDWDAVRAWAREIAGALSRVSQT